MKNGIISNIIFKFFNFGIGFVDVEWLNDDYVGVYGEIFRRDGDGIDDSVVDGVDVEFELGWNGDNWWFVSDCVFDEFENRFVVLFGSFFFYKIDFILENDDFV